MMRFSKVSPRDTEIVRGLSSSVPNESSSRHSSIHHRLSLLKDTIRRHARIYGLHGLQITKNEQDSEASLWTDSFTLDLSADVSKDISEIEYLRRSNKEEAGMAKEVKQIIASLQYIKSYSTEEETEGNIKVDTSGMSEFKFTKPIRA